MSVRDWPKYLLRDMPPHIRSAIEEDADREGRAMIEIIREILCGHYDLDCPPVDSSRRRPTPGTSTMMLRLQPELWEAIKMDIHREVMQYGAMDRRINSILAAHYNGG